MRWPSGDEDSFSSSREIRHIFLPLRRTIKAVFDLSCIFLPAELPFSGRVGGDKGSSLTAIAGEKNEEIEVVR